MITGWNRSWGNVAIVVGGMLMMSVARAQSPTIQPDLPSFGLVGITPASQFVRLNVTNVRVAGLAFLAPPGTLTVGPCAASLDSYLEDRKPEQFKIWRRRIRRRREDRRSLG
jgi:hypothetical protein